MKPTSIPTYYFPTTALFLDDNHDFLLNFVLQLDEGVAYRIFDAPRRALDYIHHKNCAMDIFDPSALNDGQEAKFFQSTVYNPHRFAEISVVIVDYIMPGMDGLEFCRQIENPYVKKILLTGQADEKLAIEAFNEGLIHRYVKKSDINAAQLITNSIYELQLEYFQAMSDKRVRDSGLLVPNCLQDPAFVNFFQQICKDHHIAEYYLIDTVGSFFMLDDDANISILNLNQNEISSNTSKRQSIFGKEIYSYTYNSGSVVFDKRHQKILSYHRFLEEIDAEELLS